MNVLTLPSTRRSASQRRRAPQIIEAAARVFAERGFHGATTQDIADVLGIRQASLYYYFSSKEAALELVCLKGVEGFFEAAKAIAAGPGKARKRLSLLINSHLSPLIDRGDFVKVFLNERQYLPTESRRRIGRWSRGLERIFEEVIKEGIANGEFRADLDTAPGDARHSRHVQCGIELASQGKRRGPAHQRGIRARWSSTGWASAPRRAAGGADQAHCLLAYRI